MKYFYSVFVWRIDWHHQMKDQEMLFVVLLLNVRHKKSDFLTDLQVKLILLTSSNCFFNDWDENIKPHIYKKVICLLKYLKITALPHKFNFVDLFAPLFKESTLIFDNIHQNQLQIFFAEVEKELRLAYLFVFCYFIQ